MKTKFRQFGFTLVEMLTVLAIIAMLIGLLVPTLSWVRKVARETKQKVQFTNINLGLTTFKNDYGDYPPSDGYCYLPFSFGFIDYCGAQKLAEALLGWDLMGFHPRSHFINDGGDVYANDEVNLKERVGPYLKFAITNTFKLGDLFDDTGVLANRFVICDVFGVKKITIDTRTFTAGTPILYYRANTSSKRLRENPLKGDGIYDFRDNSYLTGLGKIGDITTIHPWANPVDGKELFYEYIRDPKVSNASGIDWPYRPDSYILISAGADGIYGTSDDITNFGN